MFGLRDDPWKWHVQSDFSGGENIEPETCKRNQLLVGENCYIDNTTGHLIKAQGCEQVVTGTGTSDVAGIWYVVTPSGNVLYVQHGVDLKAAYWNGQATIDISAFTVVKAAIGGLQCGMVRWKDKAIFFRYDGSGPFYFDLAAGTPFTPVNLTFPGGVVLRSPVIYGNRLFGVQSLAGNSESSFIMCSAISDPNSWDALDVIGISIGDGDYIEQLVPTPGGLIIMKHLCSFVLYGISINEWVTSLAPIYHVGSISGASASDPYVLGIDNIYKFNLSGATPLIEHQNTFFNNVGEQGCIAGMISIMDQCRFLSVCYPGKEIIYDTIRNVMFKGSSNVLLWNFGAARNGNFVDMKFFPANVSVSDPQYYDFLKIFLSGGNYKVYGSKISINDTSELLRAKTRYEDFDIDQEKLVRGVKVVVDAAVSNATIIYYLNFSNTPTTLYTGALAAGENIFPISPLRCRNISIEIQTTAPMLLKRVGVRVRPVGNKS